MMHFSDVSYLVRICFMVLTVLISAPLALADEAESTGVGVQDKLLSSALVDSANVYHHHIHNFYFNDSDKSKPNYLAMQAHALAMSYDATTHYLANTLPGNLDSLKRILLHNAYYIPLSIDFDKHQAKYTVSYLGANNRSLVNPDRVVWNAYPLNNADIEILKGYGCAQSKEYVRATKQVSLKDAKSWFRIDKDYGKVIANWQSRFVVEDLAKKTIQTLQLGKYDYLFLDDLPRNPGNCVNSTFGGKGAYASWKEGQLAFLQMVTDAAHAMKGRQAEKIKVLGNLWSPYPDVKSAQWYADKKLRLDHYYFESGGYAREDIFNGQASNGQDTETALPAFMPLMGGYIPAHLVSLGTHIETMNSLAANYQQEVAADYLRQHYMAAGIAATQGSWFGWYGETSVDKLDSRGTLIHSNAMQLLRVIPNWENLAKVSTQSRVYSKAKNTYYSPNSGFSNDLIYGVNPLNNEMYVVFMTTAGQLDLKGKKILSATFVDAYFNKTQLNALSCLSEMMGKVTLKCSHKMKVGIRLNLE